MFSISYGIYAQFCFVVLFCCCFVPIYYSGVTIANEAIIIKKHESMNVMIPLWTHDMNTTRQSIMNSCESLQWRHNERDGGSIHQPHEFFYSTVYSDADQRKHQSSASLAFVRGIHPGTGEFPEQMASNAENVSIRWHHHGSIQRDYSLLCRPT